MTHPHRAPDPVGRCTRRSRCHRPGPMDRFASMVEILTACRTPAALAAATRLATCSVTAVRRNSRSTPSIAGGSVSGRSRSPTTDSIRPPRCATLVRSRASTRTGRPVATSWGTSSLPTLPVPPVTRITTPSHSAGRRGSSPRSGGACGRAGPGRTGSSRRRSGGPARRRFPGRPPGAAAPRQ